MKKSRKKMLLSSIAMLLVALVALGSATFAWYITNATVTAEKTQFSAASADGLVIRHTTSDTWSDKVTDLAKKESLTPASISYDNTLSNNIGATGQGTAFNDGTLNGNGLQAATVENGNVFLVDSFYVASSSGAAKNATFTIKSGTKEGTYLNLAVYVGTTLQGVWTSATGYTSTQKVGGTSAAPETASGTQTLVPLAANTNAGTISAATKESGGTQITIIGFVDGYNPLCKNSTANISTIDVEYSFTAA